MFSHPELDSDPLIGSDRESGCDIDKRRGRSPKRQSDRERSPKKDGERSSKWRGNLKDRLGPPQLERR